MDQERFAELSRRVSSSTSRRNTLRIVAAGVFAGFVGNRVSQPAEAGVPIVSCKVPGQFCNRDRNCCSLRCNKGICGCAPRGNRCWQPLEGSLCCSGRCRRGRCK